MTTKKKRKARRLKARQQKDTAVENQSVVTNGKSLQLQTPPSPWQLRPNDGQGIFTSIFNSYIPRKVDAEFYEFLREAIPTFDAAIQRLTELDGHLIVKGNNGAMVEEIGDWMDNVPVNDIQTGLQAFDNNFTSEAHEQGFVIGEYVSNKKRNDIVGLRVADSKYIKFKRTDNGLDIYQKGNNDTDYRLLNRLNLMYFSINNENQNPYGTSLMRSCEFVSKILVTIHNTILNVFERFGDPCFSLIYKTSKKDGGDHASRRKKMEEDLKAVNTAKRKGNSADFVYAIDKDSDITIKVIGHDNQVLEFEVPARIVEEEIVAKTALPAWMLGKHWSTTERLSDAEANILLAAVKTRQAAKMPRYKNLIRTLLLLRGRTWEKGDWDLEWAQVNLHDIVKQAQARFLNSQADMMQPERVEKTASLRPRSFVGNRGWESDKKKSKRIKEDRFSGSLCPCCNKTVEGDYPRILDSPTSGGISGGKELNRPTDWPELDEVEDNYETELKYDWNELTEQIFSILKLPADELISVTQPPSREEQLTKGQIPLNPPRSPSILLASANAGAKRGDKQPPDIPPAEVFNFSIEQRASIMQALRNYLGLYDWRNTDSAVTWYYGLAYSLGVLQAARFIGEERPILDIIKNKETFNKLTQEGFKLVKENATKEITNKILPEIEAQVIAGTNPRHVATRLKKIFGDQNSDWERLARSEISMAAEKAKLDEWKEWEIKEIEFIPAPDACPICLGVAGVYNINAAPIPVSDTHPRCRCTIAPV